MGPQKTIKDLRLTPARPDLAAAHLKGQVEAERFVKGEQLADARGHIPVRARPEPHSSQETELLCGEIFTVYEQKEGWAWGQIQTDGYVGYVSALSLARPVPPTHRVRVPLTPVLTRPDVKADSIDSLPMNALVATQKRHGDFFQTHAGFVFYRHLAPLDEHATDFVAVAEQFLGVPYVWGGKTFAGMDCSGLIQTALHAAGAKCLRDTDMQEKSLGETVVMADLRRGDLVFWKGHVGMMRDATHLLHANAFHMQVALEPLAEAMVRIEKVAGTVTSIKRL